MLLLPLLLLPSLALASFCGQEAVPFTFQVLKSGQPVLGCARPRCFGSGRSNGTGEPAQFYRVHGKEDGYMRKSEGTPSRRNEISACSMSFSSSSCGIGQWVGGIAPQADVKTPQQLRCCAYGPLLQSEDRGIASVRPGQLVVGGEVSVDGRVVAFDYIADLAKTVKEDGTVEYNVALRRMSCFDDEGSSEGIIGEPSDLSLQQITAEKSKPVPYSPWANTPQPVAQQPAFHSQHLQLPQKQLQQQQPSPAVVAPSPTAYPGQPRGLQPMESAATAATAAAAPTPSQLQQQQQQAQQTAALAYMSPQLNPMVAQLAQQQAQLAEQQKALLAAQQELLAAQKQVQQQRAQQQQQPVQQARGGGAGLPEVVNPLMLRGPLGAFNPMTMGGRVPAAAGAGGGGQQMTRLPNLEELPKLNIPSIEQVENAIPPLEKAVLTTVARFFGVL